MKNSIKLILLFLLVSSCISKKQYSELEVKNKEQRDIIQEYQFSQEQYAIETAEVDKFIDAKDKQLSEFLDGASGTTNEIKVEKSEEFEFLNGKLPKTFYERDFYKGLSATTYDLFTLPGKIVKKTGNNTYKILTPVQLIKSGTVLENDYIEDGVLFKDYLAKGMSANGSYVIGSFEAKKDQVVEITLTDVLKAFPKQEVLDINRLKKYQEQIKNKEDSEQYFFIQSATLTIGTGRTFNSSKFKKEINSIYLTASGEVYKTDEQIKNERIVTVELISLKDMLL
ncbi:hypothetical protein N7U66_08500 [Lacinutrix neustonica]|uniref:Lipoprotein n=1 Tax=Lacinutrix neustonica TaxID=2980107 RepID=A0A9E8MZT0_9FLAO|nr:hypothetical protein [Lacinutrix neustonica]WAC03507.1 hypothetical protein N7U66_08500 [Lacinutrix neustonica]